MKAKFIAYITAAALAVTSVSGSTAQAGQDEDILKIIAGLAILSVIVNNKSEPEATKNNKRKHYKSAYKLPRHCFIRGNDRRAGKSSGWNNNGQRRDQREVRINFRRQECLPPRQCLRVSKTRKGWHREYSERCLAKMGWRWGTPELKGRVARRR